MTTKDTGHATQQCPTYPVREIKDGIAMVAWAYLKEGISSGVGLVVLNNQKKSEMVKISQQTKIIIIRRL